LWFGTVDVADVTKPNYDRKVPEPSGEALLNMARQYHSAANALFSVGGDTMSPLYFLYTHAIELTLKAYIRSLGCSVPRIHVLQSLFERCRAQGLQVGLDLAKVIRLLESENELHGFRYFTFISTGTPEIGYLRQVVDDLMITVTEEIRKKPGKYLLKGAVLKFTVGKPERKLLNPTLKRTRVAPIAC
jgi:HEPN domain-containing protein